MAAKAASSILKMNQQHHRYITDIDDIRRMHHMDAMHPEVPGPEEASNSIDEMHLMN